MTSETAAGMVVTGHRLSPEIMQSLKEASAKTGVDFDFLVAQATAESGLRGEVRARQRHSSAAGLFQFNEQTWMEMVRQHGGKYGLGDLAARITTLADGHLGTTDRALDNKILDLRKDVRLSAFFAGELAKHNAVALQKALHRKADAADLHVAHLLGTTGAIRFLERGDHTPKTVAAVYGKIKAKIETPLKQLSSTNVTDGLRPGAGLTDAMPKKRGV